MQEDVFAVFDKARQLSRTDSQLFDDACELQMVYIRTRDELCKRGMMRRTCLNKQSVRRAVHVARARLYRTPLSATGGRRAQG
jgi:protein polybromo-1